MKLLADSIIPAAQRNRLYAGQLLQGIPAECFARKPTNINLNHAAFLCGHLAIYFPRILTIAGADPSVAQTPPEYTELFKHGAPCHDDPAGSIYPPMEELITVFSRCYDAALPPLANISDETLQGPINDERMKTFFESAGAAVNYLLVNHVAQHLGQLSSWRRCMGLAPV